MTHDVWLGEGVLALHLGVIAFNLFGLVVIPIGAWRGWTFVRAPLWRWLHLASMAVVALQALAGRACFLTVWQDRLSGSTQTPPLIMRFINSMIFWPLPMWVFTAVYAVVFVYVLTLFVVAPPRPWSKVFPAQREISPVEPGAGIAPEAGLSPPETQVQP